MRPAPMTAAAFAPFGELIEAPSEPGRRSFADGLDHDERRAVLSTTRAAPVELPLAVHELERHPHSTQTFLPLDVARWIVIVSNTLDPVDVRAFEIGAGLGVTIRRGVWHHGLTVLDRPATFAVLMWKDGETDDEFAPIAPFMIEEAR